jgi:hypothetical protein
VILNETIGGIVHFFYDSQNELLIVRINHKYRKVNHNFENIQNELHEILPLINFVNKTFKIGNDFSHYERKLEHYTTKDLEQNINKILEYISTKYKITETQKKIIQIDEKFNNYKL